MSHLLEANERLRELVEERGSLGSPDNAMVTAANGRHVTLTHPKTIIFSESEWISVGAILR